MPHVLRNLRVKVLFFGPLRELTGISEEAVEILEGANVAELFDRYAGRFPNLAAYRVSLVASRNEEFASWDTPLAEDDTIAFLPPVSGG